MPLTQTDERFKTVVDTLLLDRTNAFRGMTAKELSDRANINYRTLMRLLPTWAAFGVVTTGNKRYPVEYYYDEEIGTAHFNRDRVITLPENISHEQVMYIKDRVAEILAVSQATSAGTMNRLTDSVWRGQMLSTATIDELAEVIKDPTKPWQSRANNALTIISLLLREEDRKVAV